MIRKNKRVICRDCKGDRILGVCGKTSDLYSHAFKGKSYDGYVPDNLGIGGGDYIEFGLCLDCGKIQDDFPKGNPKR
jgi:hypothetical protein